MDSITYNRMTVNEKANYYFQKFRADFNNWDCQENDANCIENRLTLLKLKYLPKEEIEIVKDLYSLLCDSHSI